MTTEPEHVRENRAYWNGMAHEWVEAAEENWASATPYWGIWKLPEAQLGLLPESMSGMDAIELGCGTGYCSGWMAARGARVTAIDLSSGQLATARRLAEEHGAAIEFIEGNAEQVPCADASFDVAFSEYGAAIWCDPDVWIPEAHRLLRPGGRLVFLGMHPLVALCSPESGAPAEAKLHRPWSALHRMDWRDIDEDPGGIEFNRSASEWLRLFRETGFEVEDYLELTAPAGARDAFAIPGRWAERWPAEQVWKLRKR